LWSLEIPLMAFLGRIALGSISCALNSSKNLFFGWFKIGIYLVDSKVTKNGKIGIFKLVSFQSFFFKTIDMSIFSIFFIPICIPFPFDWIESLFDVFEWNLEFWIKLKNLNWIQINLHAMSFNNFIWRNPDFHKINSFFSSIDHHW